MGIFPWPHVVTNALIKRRWEKVSKGQNDIIAVALASETEEGHGLMCVQLRS